MNATADTTLVHAGTFAVLGGDGGVSGRRGASPDGVFQRDARHLSLWSLTVDGAAPAVLVPSAGEAVGDFAGCVLTPPGTRDEPPGYTVFREQSLAQGVLTERIRLVSNRSDTTVAMVAVTADADFADQFELRSDGRCYDKGEPVEPRVLCPTGSSSCTSVTTGSPAPPSPRPPPRQPSYRSPAGVPHTGWSGRWSCLLMARRNWC